MGRTLPILALLALLHQFAGCLYIPAIGGKKPSKEALLAMKPSVTTREEILHRLGKPNALDHDRFYAYEMEKGRGTMIVAWGGGGSLGKDFHRLLFEFDSVGVLTRWGMERAGGPTDTPLPDRKPVKHAATAVVTRPAPELRTLPAERLALSGSKSFHAIALSHDGAVLAAVERKGRLWLRDQISGAETTLAEPKEFASLRRTTPTLEFSHDGDRLFLMSKGVQDVDPSGLTYVDLPVGLTKLDLQKLREATAMAVHPTERRVAMGCRKGSVRVLDPARNAEVSSVQAHKTKVSSVAYSPDGRLLVTSAVKDSARIWNTATWEEVARLPTRAGAARFSPDGFRIALRTAGWVEIWRLHDSDGRALPATITPTLEQVFLLPVYTDLEFSPEGLQMAFSRDGRYLAVPVGSCVVYDTWTRQVVWRYLPRSETGDDAVSSWAFAPDGRKAAIATPEKIYWIEGDWRTPVASNP